MKDSSWLLVTGLFLVFLGFILKFTDLGLNHSMFFSAGGGFKIVFLAYTMIRKNYRPGREMLFLIVGLFLVITGAKLRDFNINIIISCFISIAGITFKLLFLSLFAKIITFGSSYLTK
ncbi:hypothetical protein QA597_00595 [Marinilabiliaceae bacterium ANBcel2]|nr:hypothetical protein [Marinilabiliaceae bacterium ANBcel2]